LVFSKFMAKNTNQWGIRGNQKLLIPDDEALIPDDEAAAGSISAVWAVVPVPPVVPV